MISIDDAWARLDAACPRLDSERLPLLQALGRVLAAPEPARCDLPPFRQSAMDGYAVHSASLGPLPCRLPLGEIVAAAPQARLPQLPLGGAVRIFTGGLVPDQADCVVQQEWTQLEAGQVVLQRAPQPGQNLRERGEELLAGTRLGEAGSRLDAGLIAALAAAGVAELEVFRLPRVALLVTGDELQAPGQTLLRGQVYDANGPLVRGWLHMQGIGLERLIYVADDEAAVSQALAEAFACADLVLSTGGVSVGDRDLIIPCAEALGAERVFWKVAQKPGKPLYAARYDNRLLLGLPGNPASVLVNLAAHVSRVLARMQQAVLPQPQPAILASRLRPASDRDSWLRMRSERTADGRVLLQPLPHQASHMISNLACADVLARLPAQDEAIEAGSVVATLPLYR